ncbi:MAG: hypothetical protein SCK57_03175 [Bacillota bacterium]|nr:hypothetical protein [Bacillota bacterium]MDW7676641.1 hypothetical protein [Bacillota bacterium]
MDTTQQNRKHSTGTKSFEIILDDLDFTFTPSAMCTAAAMWEGGSTVKDIANVIRPHGNRQAALDETTLLLIHLRRRKRIKMRETGRKSYGSDSV